MHENGSVVDAVVKYGPTADGAWDFHFDSDVVVVAAAADDDADDAVPHASERHNPSPFPPPFPPPSKSGSVSRTCTACEQSEGGNPPSGHAHLLA